ncbi:MAG TPA: hypothetical protein VFN61_08450 [Acidimicrobiales bacterium]|nr:hypothetical protein [Acidimicrobiales bacterium]
MEGEDWLVKDWAAANRRLAPVADLSGQIPADARTSVAAGALDLSAIPERPRPRGPAPAHIWLTRVWALVKMASLGASTWWAMSSIHAHLGALICAYGAVALFSGVGARWRKRYFGPGQLIEPELYEALGSLLYRVGTALVLVGGVIAMVAPAIRA